MAHYDPETRASAFNPAAVKPLASVKRRPRVAQVGTFGERMASEARRLREQAQNAAPGLDREMLLRKAGQTETAAHINEWLSSPRVMSPK